MAPLGLRGYPANMLLDHLLSACYMEVGDSYIPKCVNMADTSWFLRSLLGKT